mmetsp:Transcript_44514/g.102896  ORF Transcript_44514/g.102896 Transcript_44514/m.102896 type:complete len:251 (+) Transcript_44514:104-856(+)
MVTSPPGWHGAMPQWGGPRACASEVCLSAQTLSSCLCSSRVSVLRHSVRVAGWWKCSAASVAAPQAMPSLTLRTRWKHCVRRTHCMVSPSAALACGSTALSCWKTLQAGSLSQMKTLPGISWRNPCVTKCARLWWEESTGKRISSGRCSSGSGETWDLGGGVGERTSKRRTSSGRCSSHSGVAWDCSGTCMSRLAVLGPSLTMLALAAANSLSKPGASAGRNWERRPRDGGETAGAVLPCGSQGDLKHLC